MSRAKGERNAASKLTAEAVREIRQRYSWKRLGRTRNPDGATALAEVYGVSRRTILAVVYGEQWGWLD